MTDKEKTEKIELDEVMLAMDVVDTLRHEHQWVERELASEERDRALFEKVKRMYASQGLDVTDKIIAEGVAALREERFVYQPPPPGGTLWLARIYVNRGKWAKAAGLCAVCLIAAFLIYRFAVVGPQASRQVETVRNLKGEISRQQDRITAAGQRFSDLMENLKTADGKHFLGSEVAGKGLLSQAELQLNGAATRLQVLNKLALPPNLDVETLTKDSDAVKRRIGDRETILLELNSHLDKAESALADLNELGMLRGKLSSQLQSLVAESREAAAKERAEKYYADALAALDSGDINGARSGSAALQDLYARLVQEYDLRIVSRPETPSGVWRYPQGRGGIRNYYVIVEAVNPMGERLTLPVTSEEDGSTRNVQQWGLRIDGAQFDKIRRDKMDDGIIQNSRIGVKERGYLMPRYLVSTTGGAITQW